MSPKNSLALSYSSVDRERDNRESIPDRGHNFSDRSIAAK